MKKLIQLSIVCFAFISIQSCGQNKTKNEAETKIKSKVVSETKVKVASISYDDHSLLRHIETLSSDKFEGRKTGTEGNKKAQDYVISQFESLGAKPFGSKYKHNFQFERKGQTFDATNVLAVVKGTEKPETYIVISAHYDHLGKSEDGKIYNGADDDASGVAALFSLAEVLKENPPKHSVILAAFDAEEMGLQGAKYFVDNMKDADIIANLNMDMISRSAKNELYVVGSRYNKGLETVIKAFKNPTNTKLLVGHDGSDDKDDWTYASDHGPFHMQKIPFLYFGNEDHAAYHKPTDDFKDITPAFYKNSVSIIISVFRDIDSKGL